MAVGEGETRSTDWRSDSKLRTLALPMRLMRLLENTIKLARRCIAFDLSIPAIPVALEQPVTELCEFRGRKLLDLLFEHFNFGHRDCRF